MKGKKIDTYTNVENDKILIGFINQNGQYDKAKVSSVDDMHTLFITNPQSGEVSKMEINEFGHCIEIQTEKPLNISYNRSTYIFEGETKTEKCKSIVFATDKDVYCILSTEIKLLGDKDEDPIVKVGVMTDTDRLSIHKNIANLCYKYPYYRMFSDKRSGSAVGKLDSVKLILYNGKDELVMGYGVRRYVDGLFILTDAYFPEIGIESHIQE
jgi:hypothetical protein